MKEETLFIYHHILHNGLNIVGTYVLDNSPKLEELQNFPISLVSDLLFPEYAKRVTASNTARYLSESFSHEVHI